jgi:hypothetical protein
LEGNELHRWAKKRKKQLFVPIDNLQALVREILREHPRLVDSRKNKSGADPFVIALAQQRAATAVTEEGAGGVRIPDVCRALSIPCLTVLGLVRQEHWRFG